MAHERLHWDRPFKTVRPGGFRTFYIAWFPEVSMHLTIVLIVGRLNIQTM
jgi:hypothetical protein